MKRKRPCWKKHAPPLSNPWFRRIWTYPLRTEAYLSNISIEIVYESPPNRSTPTLAGLTEGPATQIFVTREELEAWETELTEQVQDTRMTLSQLIPLCAVPKMQVPKDILTLGSSTSLEAGSEIDRAELEFSEGGSETE